MTVTLDGSSLTLRDLVRAAGGGVPVVAADEALERMAVTAAEADLIAEQRPVYGRSTGVGANRTLALDSDVRDPGLALLRSHAVSAGARRSPERVRATLVVRTNQLLAAGSGASPDLAVGMVGLLADGDLPPLRELGGLGTGDLGALATIGIALLERGVEIGMRDALPLMSSNAATLADAALAADALTGLASTALEVAAVTFAAVDGNAEAFAPVVERITPLAGPRYVARTMRELTAGSVAVPARIQDPFALRTLPQVHGSLFDALDRVADTVTRFVNGPTENPVYDGMTVAHHGGFHAATLTMALDTVRLTALAAARLSRVRLGLLCEPEMTTLPPFLGDPGRPGASGVLALEYVSGSALGELHLLAQPAATASVSVSRGVEEDASFASLAARSALATVAALRTVVACELLAGLRALRMRGREIPAVWTTLVGELDPDIDDRDLTADLDLVDAGVERASTGRAERAGRDVGQRQ